MFVNDSYDDGGGSGGESERSDREYHVIDPKDLRLELSPESIGMIGELSKKSLTDSLDEYDRVYRDSIFSQDSYTGVEGESMFVGLDFTFRIPALAQVGAIKGKVGLLFDFTRNRMGLQVCAGLGGGVGTPLAIKVVEFDPYSQVGVPNESDFTFLLGLEAWAAFGLGVSTDSRRESLVVGFGGAVGGTASVCFTQRVRYEAVDFQHIHY